MKKPKKHSFRHIDPETIAVTLENKAPKNASLSRQPINKEGSSYLTKDLKKTIIVITLLILAIITLYFIQAKTGYLKPVLKIFGL